MRDKNWYKKNYEFYRSAALAQIERVKKLEQEVRNLKAKIKDLEG